MNKNRHLHSAFFGVLFKSWMLILLFFVMPINVTYGQDSEDDVEVFFDDEEFDDEDYDDDEYLDDEEYEDGEYDDEEYDDEEYEDEEYEDEEYEDDEYEDDEYEDDEASDTELSDEADRLGYTLDIAVSSPRFVNTTLQDYNSNVDARLSFEFPMLMRVLGVKFRFGAEIGTFKFERAKPPNMGQLASGITGLGLLVFPAGPGKVKIGTGMIGGSFGFMAEASYGLSIAGLLDLRFGFRTTEALNLSTSNDTKLGHGSWMDGVILLGINL